MSRVEKLVNNTRRKRYEMASGKALTIAEYIIAGEKIFLTHTEVPPELKGRGKASALVKAVLEDIAEKDLRLVPQCPFVAAYIRRHPEWKRVLSPEVNID